jgi:hypothetical protein
VLTLVNGEGEADQQWAIETNGLDGVVRERPTTFTPGMPLTLTIHPLRDGTNGGLLLIVVLPDGSRSAVAVIGQSLRKIFSICTQIFAVGR